jgi:hypothetical protein
MGIEFGPIGAGCISVVWGGPSREIIPQPLAVALSVICTARLPKNGSPPSLACPVLVVCAAPSPCRGSVKAARFLFFQNNAAEKVALRNGIATCSFLLEVGGPSR